MARPGVCLAVSSAVACGAPCELDDVLCEVVPGERSQLRKSHCRLAGRPGLPGVVERGRRLAWVVCWVIASAVSVSGAGDGTATVGVESVATRGRVRRASPGEAGRVRRRAPVGTAEDEDETCSGAGG